MAVLTSKIVDVMKIITRTQIQMAKLLNLQRIMWTGVLLASMCWWFDTTFFVAKWHL